MKSITVAFLCTLLVVAVVAQKTKRCKREEDCDAATECCIDRGLFKDGRCQPLAKEDKPCSDPEDANPFNGKHNRDCPCEAGLQCLPEEERDWIFGKVKINERCVAEGAVTTPAPETEAPVEETEAPAEE